ncbi:MAG: GFA family protein [Pseudomonadaceae bacterium]|nr:GFA family protein [Pseudomonadaceae bacterium]
MAEQTLRGSCLCGGIEVQVRGEIGQLDYCHCSQCRKASGTAFASNAPITTDRLAITGSHLVKEFAASDGKWRAFCGTCGSPIYSRRASRPNEVRLRVGLLDDAIAPSQRQHIWADSRANWHEIDDSLPAFSEDAGSSPLQQKPQPQPLGNRNS